MSREVEFTDEFEAWWNTLSEDEQISVDASVRLLEARGPQLPFPHSSGIQGSRHGHMRELRTQHQGRPYRTLYAFDPRPPFYSSAATKRAMACGTSAWCPLPTSFMTSIWSS